MAIGVRKLFVLFCFFSEVVMGVEGRIARVCNIFVAPSLNAKRACQLPAGTQLTNVIEQNSGFAKVETPDCMGYAPLGCLADVGGKKNYAVFEGRKNSFKLGISGNFDGLFGKIGGESGLSRGLGYGIAARMDFPITHFFQFSIVPGYQVSRLGRNFELSGAITDPVGANFTQTVRYYTAAVFLGWVLQSHFILDSPTLDPELWLEVGLQYQHPTSATQSSAFETSANYTPKQKPLYLLIGPSVDIAVSRYFSLVGHLHLFYNLRANNGSRLFGGRMMASIAFRL